MRTLNDITADLIKINDLIEASIDEHGEIVPEVADLLSEWFNAAQAEKAAKYEAYLGLMREKEMRAVAAKAEKEQWAKKEKSETRGVEFLKSRLKQAMELLGETKVVTASGRVIAIQNNGGEVPLEIDEEKINAMNRAELISLETMGVLVLEPMLNKAGLRELLKAGAQFAFAKLGERGTQLRIR